MPMMITNDDPHLLQAVIRRLGRDGDLDEVHPRRHAYATVAGHRRVRSVRKDELDVTAINNNNNNNKDNNETTPTPGGAVELRIATPQSSYAPAKPLTEPHAEVGPPSWGA